MFSLLYIDDEPGLLELGQLFLERTGEFTVTTALSADAGLACLAQRDFDAVISDYQMPGMDGISLLKNVRKSYGNIPFVLFTGRGREEVVIEAINNGVDFYLQKGGDPKAQFAELAHKVRQAVNRRQAETALSDSEKRLADIINFLPDATFAIDTQGVVIAWNRAMEQMTGVSSAEILGKGNFEYAIPFYQERRPLLINLVLDDDPALAEKYPFVKREGTTLFSEITIPHLNDGRGAALWFTASPLYNRNGDIVGAIESIREVTERKQAEEDLVSANREYTNLLDQIQDVYYRSDTEGRLVRASRSWATLFGYDDISECLDRSIADDFYVNPSDRKGLLDEIYRNGKVSGYEVLLKKKDGTPVLVEASSHLSYDPAGKIIGIEGTFRDITARKKADAELRAANEHLVASDEELRTQYDELASAEQRIRMSEARLRYMLGFYEYGQKGERELLEYAIEGAGIVTGSPLGYLAFMNEDESELSMYAWSKSAMAECSMREKPVVYKTVTTGLWGEAVRQRRPVTTNDYAAFNPAKKGYPDGHPPIIRHMNVPVIDEGHIVLVAGVANKPADYTENDVSELQLLMQGLWSIIKRKRLQEEQKAAYEQLAASEEELQQQYEQLKKNEEELRMLKISVDQSADEVFWLDFEGNILNVNDAACRINGYLREEFLRKTIFDLNPDLTPDIWAGTVFDLRQKKTQLITTRHKRKDGATADVEIMAVYVNQDGREYSFAFVRDITGRRQAEEALGQANVVVENSPVIVFRWKAEEGWPVAYVSNNIIRFGYSPEELVSGSVPYAAMVHPADLERVAQEVQKYSAEGVDQFRQEYRIVTRSGTVYWVDDRTVIERDPNGRITHYQGILMDITEQKRAGEALRESERKYRILYETAEEGIWTVDAEFRTTSANQKMQEIFGYTEQEMMGRPVWDFVPPDDAESMKKELFKRPKAIPGRYERRWVKKDGTIVWCFTSATPLFSQDGTFAGSFGMFTDITERKRAGEDLFNSRQMLQLVLDTIPQRVFWKDRNSVYLGCNLALAKDAGYADPAGLIGKDDYRTASKATADQYRSDDLQVMESGQPKLNFEEPQIKPDGSHAWLRTSKVPLRDKEGNIIGVLGTYEDITELRRAEESLRESEAKFRAVINQSFEFIGLMKTDGTLIEANRAALSLIGISETAVINRPFWETPWWSHSRELQEKLKVAIHRAASGEIVRFEATHPAADGHIAYIDFSIKPVVDPEGRVLFLIPEGRDITERKLAEDALRESEEQYRMLVEHNRDGVFIIQDGRLVFYNNALAGLSGYTADELDGRLLADLIAPEDREMVVSRARDRTTGSRVPELYEFSLLHKNGTDRIRIRVSAGLGSYKGRPASIGTFYDVTEDRRKEDALRESEAKFRELAELLPQIVFEMDTDMMITFVNRQAYTVLGYTPDEVKAGINALSCIDPSQHDLIQTNMRKLLGKEIFEHPEYTFIRKDGSTFPALIYADPVFRGGILSGYRGIIIDISDRKQAEDALRESEEKCRTILDTTSEWIWDLDLHGCHTYSNPAVESLLGYTRDEILGISTFEMIHPDDRDRIEQIFASSVSKKSGWRNVRIRWLHKDGTYRFLESNATAIFNDRGELTGFRGADRDITESIRAEDALRESEEKFRALVETTSDFIWEVDASGSYSYVSPQVRQILGYEPEELIGRTPFDFMPPDEAERISSDFNRCVASRLPIMALENKAIRKDGSVVVLETSGVVRTANDGRYLGYRGIDRDITMRKEAAERTTRLSALKQDLLRTAPLEEKLEQITDGIVDIFGADFARIWMSGPGDLCDRGCIHAEVTRGPHICRNRKHCLHLIASSGRYTRTDGNHRRVPLGAYKIGRLATGEEAHFITNDVTHDPRVHDHAWAESLGLVSFSGFRLVSPEGEPVGALAFFSREPVTQDIVDDLDDLATSTSQVIQTGMAEEAQREREEWARTILNTAQTGIVLIDAETHRILDANPKALGMIGLPWNSVIGRVCHHFICPAEVGICPVTDDGQVVDTSERILVTAAETMIPVLKTVVSVSLGGKKVLVESFVDISEQKRSEAAIREVNRKLNLLSSITRHDVANQLTVIQGYTQLAALSNPEPVIADFLAKIESGIDTIQHQIEFTRTYEDLGVQAPAWFLIGDVIRSVGHEGIRLVCTCKSYEIYADPMIGRVFFNLFDNAVRYGERVTTVRAGCAKKGKTLVIRFADNGIGIPSNEKKKIFQKGYGKHTGFGLFLAREILAITGITIQETGIYGKGAVFEITVPEGSFRKAD